MGQACGAEVVGEPRRDARGVADHEAREQARRVLGEHGAGGVAQPTAQVARDPLDQRHRPDLPGRAADLQDGDREVRAVGRTEPAPGADDLARQEPRPVLGGREEHHAAPGPPRHARPDLPAQQLAPHHHPAGPRHRRPHRARVGGHHDVEPRGHPVPRGRAQRVARDGEGAEPGHQPDRRRAPAGRDDHRAQPRPGRRDRGPSGGDHRGRDAGEDQHRRGAPPGGQRGDRDAPGRERRGHEAQVGWRRQLRLTGRRRRPPALTPRPGRAGSRSARRRYR